MDLSIIIVSFNTRDITRNCLKSIYKSKTNFPYEIIVVDNDSDDGSLDMVKHEFPKVKAIQSGENGGFAKANNLGSKQAIGKFIWLLNSDTILQPDTIEQLLTQAIKSDAVVASCRLLNPDGSIQPQGGALPNLLNLSLWMLNLDEIPFIAHLVPPYQDRRIDSYTHDRPAGWLGGTALLIRRDVYMSLNGLDDHIFMYGEDTDFCYRVKRGFLPIHYFNKPQLTHLGQASGSSERAVLGEFAGLKYLYSKHHTPSQLLQLKVWLKLGALLRVLMYTCLRDTIRKGIYAKAFKLA